ncbi:hypothetical protein THIOKS12130006 [Thiocapsa sp. KS1]|nr:hypothetical protein THIOKS12130006 [Thiocapsa sp. KS1]
MFRAALERDRSASGLSKTPGLAREKDSRAFTWSQAVRRSCKTFLRLARHVAIARPRRSGPPNRRARVAGAADTPSHWSPSRMADFEAVLHFRIALLAPLGGPQ